MQLPPVLPFPLCATIVEGVGEILKTRRVWVWLFPPELVQRFAGVVAILATTGNEDFQTVPLPRPGRIDVGAGLEPETVQLLETASPHLQLE